MVINFSLELENHFVDLRNNMCCISSINFVKVKLYDIFYTEVDNSLLDDARFNRGF